MTEWKDIIETDWPAIASTMHSPKFLFDGRNALDAGAMATLGFQYVGIGRGVLRTDVMPPSQVLLDHLP